MATTLKWPMTVGGDGKFVTVSGVDDLWASRVSQLMCSRLGERVMRRDYGADIVSTVLFENALFSPETSVKQAVQQWLPGIRVDDVKVHKSVDTYVVEVLFTTPNGSALSSSVDISGRNS